ncbi:unnamed protein product [Caenorhabditis auriculariae]|uniref:Uncharacterized protein n=1 Tax=Caenorhabditis auriculariae TaxID=2777116 RepID=A0A8S1H882_9PELO|nr:unnamed protein product [Caenorhabditis auriculariae]
MPKDSRSERLRRRQVLDLNPRRVKRRARTTAMNVNNFLRIRTNGPPAHVYAPDGDVDTWVKAGKWRSDDERHKPLFDRANSEEVHRHPDVFTDKQNDYKPVN